MYCVHGGVQSCEHVMIMVLECVYMCVAFVCSFNLPDTCMYMGDAGCAYYAHAYAFCAGWAWHYVIWGVDQHR